MKTDNPIVAELQRIASENGGILQPVSVVDAARAPESPLHSQFQWDDSVAAHQHRLFQARQLIRVCVTMIPNGNSDSPDCVWVSLKQDRILPNGGYRPLVTVLSNATLREALLAEALSELETFKEKYGRLQELSELFRVASKVSRKQVRRPQPAQIRA